MSPDSSPKVVVLAVVVLVAAATAPSCGSVTSTPDGGTAGAAGSQSAGTGGAAGTSAGGTGGAGGVAGTSAAGKGGASAGGTGGTGAGGTGVRLDGGTDGPLACTLDLNNCPTGFTCACGGPGPGVCTCHKNCSDVNACPAAEPMCGCPGSTTGTARFCVNACFCTCN